MTSHRLAAIAPAALALLLVVVAAMPAFAGERLLQRQRPLSVRWGEVEVAESSLVKIVKSEEETTYPHALALVFKTRQRQEDMQGLLEGTSRARSQSMVSGTLYLAARMDDRGDWDGFTARLQEAAGRLTPAGYEGFLGSAGASLMAAAERAEGAYTISYCVAVPGGAERGGEVHRTIVRDSKGVSSTTGDTTYGKSVPACAPLRDAFAGRPPVDVLTTGFAVDDSFEETLDLAVEERLQQPPVAMPEGVSLSIKDVPEGVNSFTSSSQNGKVHGETLRRGGVDGAGQGRGKDFLVVVDLHEAALARELPRGRCVLTRWDVSRRETRLGAPPRTLSEDRQTLLMGVFCTAEGCALDLGPVADKVAAGLADSNPILSAEQVQGAIEGSRLSLPPDALVVFCPAAPGRDRRATFCVSNACAAVLNPAEVCGDLESALPD